MIIDPDTAKQYQNRPYKAQGEIWWRMNSLPGDSILDVALRLGMSCADVSAIKSGHQLAPKEPDQ